MSGNSLHRARSARLTAVAATASVLGVLVGTLGVSATDGTEAPDDTAASSQPAATGSSPVDTTLLEYVTIDAFEGEELEVIEATRHARDVWIGALIDREAPDLAARLDEVVEPGSPARLYLDDYLERLERDNHSLRAPDDGPLGRFLPESVTRDADDPDVWVVVACIGDAAVVYEPGAGDDGGDLIVDDQVGAFRTVFGMRRHEDTWRIFTYDGSDVTYGTFDCLPEEPATSPASPSPSTAGPAATTAADALGTTA